MEPLAPFELDALRRDWIVGVSGEAFFAKVQENIESLKNGPGLEKVVVVPEQEPVEFAAFFFAAVWLGVPLALANPKWVDAEQDQFDALINEDGIERGSILIPTGGTTGGVKLAIHTWSSLNASALAVWDFLGERGINSCCLLPLFHVSGLMQLVRSFVTGGTIRFDDSDVSDCCLSLVPTQLQRALANESSIRKMNTVQAIFVGGARIPDAVAAKVRELRLPVIPVYGMTETAAMCAAVPNADFLEKPDAGAVPIGDATFSIEDDGRIRIRSTALFKGYCGQPSPDLSGGFVVNDEGHLDDEGRLHVAGRVDHLINTGGEKVDPLEVESTLLHLEGVTEALVVGESNDEWGQAVVAYVVGNVPSHEHVWFKEQLSHRLAYYKIPKQVYVVETLPLDARGKYLRPQQRS
ncbi:MAG: AMP-binding protein [Verrucomicrobiota bacterium]